jgi:5-methylcytosine-specific restriction protein B
VPEAPHGNTSSLPQILFQPAGNPGSRDHYRDTIEQPVPLGRLAEFLDVATISSLRSANEADAVATWGVTPGRSGANEKKWEKIGTGDVAVFLRESRAYSSGVVVLKTRNAPLAEALWGRDEHGQTWECLYFLGDVRAADVSYRDLNRAARYQENNNFQGFTILEESRAPEVLALLERQTETSNVWWVNEGTTYRQQKAGGYLWAPTANRQGTALAHHRNVMRLKVGDLVLRYSDGQIRGVGTVKSLPSEAARPAEFPEGPWNPDGYRADLSNRDLAEGIALTDIPEQWRQTEAGLPVPQPHPFNRDGGVAVGYLYELSSNLVTRLRSRFPILFREGPMEEPTLPATISPEFSRALRDAHLIYSDADVTRFIAALLTKPFVILSGLSGSGKTKLAQALGYWLGRGEDGMRAAVLPVGPDWTSVDDTLGYPNALDPSQYSTTEVLERVLSARNHPDLPYILVLDEMNLSHVERYFADILSAMESGEEITLYTGGPTRGEVPNKLKWPPNIFLIGTVNVDETTYMFSPKVLDRANVIEFRIDPSRLASSGDGDSIDLEAIEGKGSPLAALFGNRDWVSELPALAAAQLRAEINLSFQILASEGHEFGYRTAAEVTRFVAIHRALLGQSWSFEASFDAQITQKLLPRLHGSRRSISSVLIAMAVLCSEPRQWASDGHLTNTELIKGRAEDESARADDLTEVATRLGGLVQQAPYPLGLEKLVRMLKRLDRNGFVSFAEA